MIGIPVNVAVASVTNQMTAGTLSSLVAYSYNGKVDYRLGSLMIMGGIGGTLIGVVIFNYLALIGRVETMIPLLLLVLLILISLTVVEDVIAKLRSAGVPAARIRDMKSVFELPAAQDMILEEKMEDGTLTKRLKTIAFKLG